MAASQSVDRQTFLANLRLSGLMSEEALRVAAATLPESNRGRVIARALVDAGLLTRFQAERLLAGRTAGFLLGQYRILEQIGRGGMGRVFKAEHLTMQRIVALKVLSPGLLSNERARELFLREVRAAAQLVHPNVVTAYDANEVDGRFFLVLEYVDGPNLDQLVRKQGPLSVGLACDYVRQVAVGLQRAHALGMVHRDIKPANILAQRHGVSEDSPGLVKISDFGLARLQTPGTATNASHNAGTILTRDNTVMGTPDYLSPEQARSLHKTDIRSDLYSLGCTFYFLLTGQVPFPGGNSLEKLIRHSTEMPNPVTYFRKDIPAPVVEILTRLLAKDPRDRYQTPNELTAALQPYAVSGQIPWAPQPATLPLNDQSSTPLGVGSSGEMAVLDELDGVAKTFSADADATPIPPGSLSDLTHLPTRPVRRLRRGQLRRGPLVVTLVTMFLGVLGLTLLLLSRRFFPF
jgi:eukaryotic-like serine/threonine-protein kinase